MGALILELSNPFGEGNALKKKKGVDKTQIETFHKNHLEILKVLKGELSGATPTDIKKKSGLSFATVRIHLQAFIEDGQVKEEKGKYYWISHYLNMIGDCLKAYTQELQNTLARMNRPESISRMTFEVEVPFPKYFPEVIDPNTPARINSMNDEQLKEYSEEYKELFEYREKILSELHRVFFDLTKILMTLDGPTVVEDDLSDVGVRFRNKKPEWSVLPSTS